MKFTPYLSLLFFLFSTSVLAQSNYTVKGMTGDSVDHVKLYNTSVSVLNAKDSTLVSFTRTGEDGSFEIKGLKKGAFILLLSYPEYADYTDHFSVDSAKQTYNFGNINMILKSRLLHEVIIKGTANAIKIKGDTTEFNAAAYKIQPNAKVEDLLKQLPGITVDKDGKITAQGEQVNKVLVDGEEFFGDDPTLVTKNIRADMVDKVQLFDKKSDQAAFTGIDDGQKTKTLNIKLKADKKNGMFGKTEDGDGPGGYYQIQALFNAFKAKQKFSVYGVFGNNSKVGLGWEDNQKYGTGDGLQQSDDGGFFFFGGNNGDDLDSFDGRYNGQGIPTARTGGVHYDTKWQDDKQSLNLNYKIGSLNIDGINDNLTQNNLPSSILNSSSNQTFDKYMFRNKLDATYQVKLDTSSNLKLMTDATVKHSTTRDNYTAMTSRNDTLVNKSTRDIVNTVDQKAFNASGLYTHKFKKVGRTFSLNVKEAFSQSEAKGFLKSDIQFFDAQGQQDSVQNIDQYKTNNLKNQALNANATYTEPLTKAFALVLNYGIGIDNSSADRKTFNSSSPGNYNVLIDSLSSDYQLNQFSNQVGAIFNYKKGKTIINFGTRVTDVRFHQVDQENGAAPLDRNFINWGPQASYQYRFSQQRSFRIGYNGNTTQPTLDQIQPIRTNTDPLNIVLGNPGLKPSFSNHLNINYNSFKVISQQFVGFYGGYNFTTDPIVSSVSTDATTGKSTSLYVNLPGKQTANFYFGGDFNRKIEGPDFNAGFGMNGNGNVSYNMVNGQLNMSKNITYSPRIQVNKYKEKKFDFYISGGPTYTVSETSLQPLINNNGWGARSDAQFNVYLPGKFQVSMYNTYEYTAKTASYNSDFSRLLLNAAIIKSFLKSESLKVELWGNDLLNQNVGFQRNASSNLITQNSYTTIKRYFMLSVSYDFTKMAGGAAKK